jgi:hypothetical protein
MIFHNSSATSARQQGKAHHFCYFKGVKNNHPSNPFPFARADEARTGNIRVGGDICDIFNPTSDNDCNGFL